MFFQLGSGDTLSIINGTDLEGTPEQVLTGSSGRVQFLSTGHTLTVHFNSDLDGVTDEGVQFTVASGMDWDCVIGYLYVSLLLLLSQSLSLLVDVGAIVPLTGTYQEFGTQFRYPNGFSEPLYGTWTFTPDPGYVVLVEVLEFTVKNRPILLHFFSFFTNKKYLYTKSHETFIYLNSLANC